MNDAKSEWLSATQIANELGVDVKRVREWPRLPRDPMPVFYPPGNTVQWRVSRDDLNGWIRRTWRSGLWKE